MIRKNTWKPDTCDCEIEYEWDDSVPQEQRTHTISNVVKACPAHDTHNNKEDHFKSVLDENQSKNRAIGLVLKNHPEIEKATDVGWRMNPDRSVVIILPDKIKVNADNLTNLSDANVDIAKVVSFE